MLKKKIRAGTLIILAVFMTFSCKEASKKSKSATKEELLKKYFTLLDSLPEHDTLNSDYSHIRAYYRNDTAFLKERNNQIEFLVENKNKWAYSESCLSLSPLNKLKASEAYRFHFEGNNCPYDLSITIYKSDDKMKIHFFRYVAGNENSRCRIVKNFTKDLLDKDWAEFKKAIKYADFWGMKEDNGVPGVHGRYLRVKGFRLPTGYPEPLYKSIYRFSPHDTALNDLFYKVLELSGNEDACDQNR
ncbi:hypothetical protein I5M27_04955 [Adhaeribacter sp. BT258]|uniref:Lipoprotein n=1 Tax=Adhaeribacter terrigena TaxID=2793070 RepID=A0ABS1BZH6_9BACT|nr:hypothetical protein [Adhaeribacter terrigena]MBK0402322.1 hypothetical protein [Adhaeribacter terrigena]